MRKTKKSMTSGYPLLEFRDLTVIKGNNKRVLDSLSLTVRTGENIAILGPNGAGKSSLIKTITRQYYPLPGGKKFRFRIFGSESWDVFELRSLLGIVSGDLQYTFNRDITGREVVLSGFFSSVGLYREHLTAKMNRKADDVIEFLEIARLKNKPINEMSSGEARRFLIGRALVHDPKALILDEPTTSLDLHSSYKFSSLLRKISRGRVSIVLVTQSLHDIIPEIGRVVLMKNGKLVDDGPKEKILTAGRISRLFGISVTITEKDGYYYALRA